MVSTKPNMLKQSKCFATLGKGQLNVSVKIEGGMHNYISSANCWYHYQGCMTSLSVRNSGHEMAFLKRDAGTDGRTDGRTNSSET